MLREREPIQSKQTGLFDLILGTRKAVRVKLLPFLEPRISRTKFVVLVELKSEPFISCTRVCQAPESEKSESEDRFNAQFKCCLPKSVSLPDLIPLDRN